MASRVGRREGRLVEAVVPVLTARGGDAADSGGGERGAGEQHGVNHGIERDGFVKLDDGDDPARATSSSLAHPPVRRMAAFSGKAELAGMRAHSSPSGAATRPRTSSETTASFAFVIATLNGASTVAATVATCARQANTFLVSDGSTDDTVGVARRAGATFALQLDENVGKPAAIHHSSRAAASRPLRVDLHRRRRHDRRRRLRRTDNQRFKPDVAIVCAKTASDWGHAQRWNPIVASRSFAYWKYQAFIRRGQSALGVMNAISGSNSVYRAEFLREVLRSDTPYVVDDTYWVLEAHRRNLGRIVYCPTTSARIQEPTTVRSWYKQNLRWMWGTFQGIIGHKIGRRATRFDLAYLGLLLDWLLFTLVTPIILAVARPQPRRPRQPRPHRAALRRRLRRLGRHRRHRPAQMAPRCALPRVVRHRLDRPRQPRPRRHQSDPATHRSLPLGIPRALRRRRLTTPTQTRPRTQPWPPFSPKPSPPPATHSSPPPGSVPAPSSSPPSAPTSPSAA